MSKNKSKNKYKSSCIKIIDMLFLALFILVNQSFAYAQTASILPPAKTTFLDGNGKPLVSGTVSSYIPGTTTPKTTWQDAAETIPNANPLTLDSAGRALLLGSGSYRQIVKDRLNNIIWDQVTSSTGSGGGGGLTATGDGDLVGTIKPWAGITAPNQYAFTYGQELSRTTFSALFIAITSTQAVFCTSGSPIITGIGDTTNFWIGMSVEIPCVGAGFSTLVSKTSSTITLAVNANTNLTTTATFFPWGRGNGTTTFNVPDYRGLIPAGNNTMGGTPSANLTTAFFGATNPNSSGAVGGGQSTTLVTGNLPPYTPTGTISITALTQATRFFNTTGANDPNTLSEGNSGGTLIPSNGVPFVSGTAIFTGNPQTGTSVAFSRIQPTLTTNYIIKITPDANSATASGVTSLGGMVGGIACGTNTLCTGNIISVTIPPVTSGFATMVPLFPQSTNPTVPWTAKDPYGNIINCTATNSQCFNEFVAAANINGWSWQVNGPGTLQSSVQLVVPPCNARTEYIDATVNFNFTVSLGASDNMTIDSMENCYQDFRGVIAQHSGDTGATVRWKPTNPTQGGPGHIVGTATHAEFFTAILPTSGGTGLIWDNTNGSIFGNIALIFNDINTGTNGFIVTNPGSGSIVFEQNKIYPGYIHGQTGKVVQIGTSSTNAGGMHENTWNPTRIDTDANPTIAWDSWASNDTYLGLSIINEIGIAGTGLKFEATANNNSLHGGHITGAIPLTDGGTCNTYIGIKGISGTINNIPCSALTTPVINTATPTAVGAVGWNGPFLNVGDGSVNRVLVDTTQAQTLTNKTLASPILTGTVTGNGTIPSAVLSPTLPIVCFIISTSAVTCNNGGSSANNGTYTTPSGAKYITVRMVGGGSGGAGGGSGSPGTGIAGGNTTFSTFIANGGAIQAGAGGTATGGYDNESGGSGGGGVLSGTQGIGGPGGISGCGFSSSSFGVANGVPTAPGGKGNGGGGGGSNTSTNPGAGGSAGGCLYSLITSPVATYSYAIGAAGTAGIAGTNGQAGIVGTIGAIEVIAYYQ